MLTAIVLAIGTGLLWVMVGHLLSTMKASGDSFPAYFTIGAVSGALITILLVIIPPIISSRPLFDPTIQPYIKRIIIWTVISGLINPVAMMFMAGGMRRGHQGLVWAISQVAMVIPFLWSCIVWRETVAYTGWFGVSCVLAAIILISRQRKTGAGDLEQNPSRTWLWMALTAFVLIGSSQVIMSIPSRMGTWTPIPGFRPALLLVSNIPVYGLYWLRKKGKPGPAAWRCGLGWGLIAVAASLMLYKSLDTASSHQLTGIVFPCIVGTSIAGFSLYSHIRLKETYTRSGLIGVILCILGVILIGSA